MQAAPGNPFPRTAMYPPSQPNHSPRLHSLPFIYRDYPPNRRGRSHHASPPTHPLKPTMFSPKNIPTTIPYLARSPLYSEEKPFSYDFDHGTSVFATSHQFDRNVADYWASFDLDTHSFFVLRGAKTRLDPEGALADKLSVEEEYARELADLLVGAR